MATNTQIKEATSFPARADNLAYPGGKTVGNGALTRLQDFLKATQPYPGGGAWPVGRPDANDAASYIYKVVSEEVLAYEFRVARQAVASPSAYEG